jgi:hypothetical protein
MGKPGIWYWLWMITLLMGGLLALATLVLWTRLPGDVRNLAMALTWGLWALATVCFFLGGIVAGFTIWGVNQRQESLACGQAASFLALPHHHDDAVRQLPGPADRTDDDCLAGRGVVT